MTFQDLESSSCEATQRESPNSPLQFKTGELFKVDLEECLLQTLELDVTLNVSSSVEDLLEYILLSPSVARLVWSSTL